jgi:aminopeptidase C
MKKLWIWLLVIGLLAACGRPAPKQTPATPKVFQNDLMLKTTPVRDQGNSPLCWVYAMVATLETDRLMMGDSVTLSTDYVARCLLQEKARRCFLSRGQADISLRGMSSMALDVMARQGMLPFDSYYHNKGTDIYTGGINYGVLCRKVEQVVRASTSLNMADRHVADLLDSEIGALPRITAMFGMTYTPIEFAHSICLPGDYEALTSFTHHPFGERFALETPDNQFHDTFLNVPIDTLMARIVSTLRSGHAVCWEGDISEPGFSFAQGRAVMPDGTEATQEARQRLFDHLKTTDDHCMMLCGLAHDQQGRRFFIAKNSWGKNNPYRGFMYLSEDYVRLKTVAVVMRFTTDMTAKH